MAGKWENPKPWFLKRETPAWKRVKKRRRGERRGEKEGGDETTAGTRQDDVTHYATVLIKSYRRLHEEEKGGERRKGTTR
jgi:hypothetical protein